MSDYSADIESGISPQTSSRAVVPGAQIFSLDLPATAYDGIKVPQASLLGGTAQSIVVASPVATSHNGEFVSGLGGFWFEMVHTWPSLIALGNMVANTSTDVELYNAFRSVAKSVTAFVNNADSGVTLESFPVLPYDINPNDGLVFQVAVSTNGPPDLDGTLEFAIGGETITIPITGIRVVMFPHQPETPVREQLEFATDIISSSNGTEQRIRIRKNPRQKLWYTILVEDDAERRKMSALLTSWQGRSLGVPIWFEAKYLNSTVSAGDLSIQVDTTYADFRVGALAIVWQSAAVFDALQIDSMTDDSLTFSSPLVNAHEQAQSIVMPLRIAVMGSNLSRSSYTTGLIGLSPQFTVLDNDSDLADTSAFSTHNGKVMLDDPNLMSSMTIEDGLIRSLDTLDNGSGNLLQFSGWPVSMPTTRKGFLANSSQSIWQVRQLLHALCGSQTSFYLPTFYHDLIASEELSSGSFLLDIEHIGYTVFMATSEPNRSIHILLVDGTVLTRQVTDAEELSADVERLTVDVAWSSTITVAEIHRISFLRLCRIADDRAEFKHDQVGEAKISMSVRGVLS